MNSRFISLFIIITTFFVATSSCKKKPYNVNVSSINADVSVVRMETDLFETDPSEIAQTIPQWMEKYKEFFQLFGYVINAGEVSDPEFAEELVAFCTDRQNNNVYSSIMSKFPNVDFLEKDLDMAFRHYLYYFPDGIVPSIFTCNTGFNNSIILSDTIIGIGLDRYLGSDCEYYPMLGLYNYLIIRMNPYNIVPDVMYAWATTEWSFDNMNYSTDNLLTEMLHEGKLRYFEKCMLPDIADTLLFGFTADQMKFCRNNEDQMWTYLMEHNLLFNTDQFTILKLVGEAPFTSYFTTESPGRAATWIGFRIIESFMRHNKNVSLDELMRMTNVQDILSGAKYVPE